MALYEVIFTKKLIKNWVAEDICTVILYLVLSPLRIMIIQSKTNIIHVYFLKFQSVMCHEHKKNFR